MRKLKNADVSFFIIVSYLITIIKFIYHYYYFIMYYYVHHFHHLFLHIFAYHFFHHQYNMDLLQIPDDIYNTNPILIILKNHNPEISKSRYLLFRTWKIQDAASKKGKKMRNFITLIKFVRWSSICWSVFGTNFTKMYFRTVVSGHFPDNF
jgi:hypothetical protein